MFTYTVARAGYVLTQRGGYPQSLWISLSIVAQATDADNARWRAAEPVPF